MPQLAFKWYVPATYAPEDFIISDCNERAAHFIDSWPKGAEPAALLTGPAASGKTHLAYRFSARTHAVMMEREKLGKATSEDLWGTSQYAIFEDIDSITDETALFHLLRHAESSQCTVLLTSKLSAQELPFTLPDLRSRLLALPTAAIAQPDDMMLFAFFTKAFADRQWHIPVHVLDYMILRTERSFSAAQKLIQQMETLISTTNKQATIPLIKPLVE